MTEEGLADLTADDATAVVLAEDATWRRLDARMLLVHPVNETIRFLPALVAIFFVGSRSPRDVWWHAGAVAIPIALGIVRYYATRFRITDTHLELRRGAFSRNLLSARLDRVRTVELTSSPIHRILGLAKVHVGTGSVAKGHDEGFALDALGTAEARQLRHALLHVAREDDHPSAGATSNRVRDENLVTFDPTWIRFAPMTTGGIVIAIGAVAAGNQILTKVITRLVDSGALHEPRNLGLAIAVGVLGFVITVTILSTLGYALANWGFALDRDTGARSLRVRKGLLTTRETNLEVQRLRGVEVHEPLGLRLVGGRRLAAIATGLKRRESSSSALVPAAPRALVASVAAQLTSPEAVEDQLTTHGTAATRRRWTHALAVAVIVDAAWALTVAVTGWSPLWYVVTVVPVLAAAALAQDRAARLGHAVTDRFLITRMDSLNGRRMIVELDGIIGVNLRDTWFQRRVGLTTLTVTTAAGRQGYVVPDVPEPEALAIADAALPGVLAQFEAVPPGQIRRR